MKAALVQRAQELGFDACRVTTAAPPDSREHFMAWLAAGRHGAMHYLARNAAKRIDPSQVLNGARSLVSLAAAYAPEPGAAVAPADTTPPPQPILRGVVARYACATDYHEVLADRLDRLVAFLTAQSGGVARSLAYVDTGPILERDLAQRAGLGFIGKHTNLISRRLGNWFFLAEILTTLELEPDPPEVNRCGTCTRCLVACPTRAIVAPFQLEARLCISYLTIEWRGSIPVELRPAIGTRIFGCDDCLAACPWNRFARAGRLMREQARPDLAAPDLIDLLSLDDEAFRRRFQGTPLLRAKRRGLLRNVGVALGNLGNPAAGPALERAAADPEPLIAEHALWALARIADMNRPSPA